MENDIISEVTVIDEGWMKGRVERTGQYGMLRSNFLEKVQSLIAVLGFCFYQQYQDAFRSRQGRDNQIGLLQEPYSRKETVSAHHFQYQGWPHDLGQFFYFRTNCAIACGTCAYMLRGFSWMSRGKKGVRNSRNLFMLFSFGPQLNAFIAVRILLKYFRRKLLQFE